MLINILLSLTSSKKLPNAKQKTMGPAKSVPTAAWGSGVRNGFNTVRVCKKKETC